MRRVNDRNGLVWAVYRMTPAGNELRMPQQFGYKDQAHQYAQGLSDHQYDGPKQRNPTHKRSRYPLTTTPAERLADDGHRRRIDGGVYHEVAVYPDKGTARIKANFTRRELGKPARVLHTAQGWSVYVAYKSRR